MADMKKGFDIFTAHEEIAINRLGKDIIIKGRDGTNASSNSVEANLLFEILKALKKSK